MGMSASQARLLTLTSRMHDTEYKAQNLENQKIALATQQDELYEKYCAALDATKIQVGYFNNSSIKLIDANYNTVCTYQENRCQTYALRNNKTNKIMVTNDIKNNYDIFGKDKYAFAYAMVNLINSTANNIDYGQYAEIGIGNSNGTFGPNGPGEACTGGNRPSSRYMTNDEYAVFKAENNSELNNLYQEIFNATTNDDKQIALDAFRDKFYMICGTKLFQNNSTFTNDDGSITDQIEYYIKIWEAINEAGGCEVIDEQYTSGDKGQTWFNNMVKAGMVTILEYNSSSTDKGWTDTSPATSINSNYLQENQDDTDLQKAEAEYEHELEILDTKDTRIDNDLSKLESERSAIKTEMDSIKTVISDNSTRTMGIFNA